MVEEVARAVVVLGPQVQKEDPLEGRRLHPQMREDSLQLAQEPHGDQLGTTLVEPLFHIDLALSHPLVSRPFS